MEEAEVNSVDLFNCHATSTPKGDASEAACIKKVVQGKNEHAFITANKGNIGHMVAGAALTESIFAIKAFETDIIPAIKNLGADQWSCRQCMDDEPIFNGLNYVQENCKSEINTIVKNSLCFGGINMSVVFKKLSK